MQFKECWSRWLNAVALVYVGRAMMKIAAVLLSLATISCGPPEPTASKESPIVSRCGALYEFGGTQEQIDAREADIGAAFEKYAGIHASHTCSVMDGYTIKHRGDAFGFPESSNNEPVRRHWGMVRCTRKLMELAPGLELFTLPHEMAHAAQGCTPESLRHEWNENGILRAIRAVTL